MNLPSPSASHILLLLKPPFALAAPARSLARFWEGVTLLSPARQHQTQLMFGGEPFPPPVQEDDGVWRSHIGVGTRLGFVCSSSASSQHLQTRGPAALGALGRSPSHSCLPVLWGAQLSTSPAKGDPASVGREGTHLSTEPEGFFGATEQRQLGAPMAPLLGSGHRSWHRQALWTRTPAGWAPCQGRTR